MGRRWRHMASLGVGLGAVIVVGPSCSSGDTKRQDVNAGGAAGSTGGTGVGGAAGGGATGGNGGSTITLDSGSTGGTTSADAGCASSSVQADLLPPNISFIVDRSGSMNCNLPPLQDSADCEMNPIAVDPAMPTKWSVIKGALKAAFAALPSTGTAGITFFNNDNVCGVQSWPNVGLNLLDATQIDALTFALDNVAAPKGGTPIVGATILGYKHLHQQTSVVGNKFVVLLTDGADTCNPTDVPRLLDLEVPKARLVNIRTFVIGAPGSEPARSLLSQIAWAGGTAADPSCDHGDSAPDAGDCHFDMTNTSDFAADLADALTVISGEALTCEFDVPQGNAAQPVDLGRVNVDYYAGGGDTVESIAQDPDKDCADADGWQYSDDDTKIVLCGSICDTVKNDASARIDIILGCETIVK